MHFFGAAEQEGVRWLRPVVDMPLPFSASYVHNTGQILEGAPVLRLCCHAVGLHAVCWAGWTKWVTQPLYAPESYRGRM